MFALLDSPVGQFLNIPAGPMNQAVADSPDLIAVQAGQPVEPPGLAPRARGLIRAEGSWRLIEAPEGRTLRARVRATLSEALEVPAALLDPAPF